MSRGKRRGSRKFLAGAAQPSNGRMPEVEECDVPWGNLTFLGAAGLLLWAAGQPLADPLSDGQCREDSAATQSLLQGIHSLYSGWDDLGRLSRRSDAAVMDEARRLTRDVNCLYFLGCSAGPATGTIAEPSLTVTHAAGARRAPTVDTARSRCAERTTPPGFLGHNRQRPASRDVRARRCRGRRARA